MYRERESESEKGALFNKVSGQSSYYLSFIPSQCYQVVLIFVWLRSRGSWEKCASNPIHVRKKEEIYMEGIFVSPFQQSSQSRTDSICQLNINYSWDIFCLHFIYLFSSELKLKHMRNIQMDRCKLTVQLLLSGGNCERVLD